MLESYLTKSRTKPRLLSILSILYEIRYATLDLLKTVNSPATLHIVTAPSFMKLKGLRILTEPKAGVFCLNTGGFRLIDKKAYSTDGGGDHDLAVARRVLQAITEHNATVIYPKFERLRLYPDALLIYKGEGRYRLEFLEVELSAKPDGYLNEKMQKYRALSKDPALYTDWWQGHRERLGLPFCGIDKFCFGVRVENVGA
jgi:hypothetical protein